MRSCLVVVVALLASCSVPEPKKPEPPPPFEAPNTAVLREKTAAGLEEAHKARVHHEQGTRAAFEQDLLKRAAAARSRGDLVDAAGMHAKIRKLPPEDVGWAGFNDLLKGIEMSEPDRVFRVLRWADAYNLLSSENLVRADKSLAERIIPAVTNKVVKTNRYHWGVRALEVAQAFDDYVKGKDYSEVIGKVRIRAAAYYRSKLPTAGEKWSRYFYERLAAEFARTPPPKPPGSASATTSGSSCSNLPKAKEHVRGIFSGSVSIHYTDCSRFTKDRRVQRTKKIEKKVPVYKTEYVGKSVTTSGYTPTSGQTQKCIATKNGKCTSWATVPSKGSGSSGGQEVFTGVDSKKVFSHYETKIEEQRYWVVEKVPYLKASGKVSVRVGAQSGNDSFRVEVLAAEGWTSGPKRLVAEVDSQIREVVRGTGRKHVAQLKIDLEKASSPDKKVAIATELMLYEKGWGQSPYLQERFGIEARVGYGSKAAAAKVANYGSHNRSLPYTETPAFLAWQKAKQELDANATPEAAGNQAANEVHVAAKRKYEQEVTEPYKLRLRKYERDLEAYRSDVYRNEGTSALSMMKRQVIGLDLRFGSSSLAETDYAHFFSARLALEESAHEFLLGVPFLGSDTTNLAYRFYIRDDSPDTLLFKLGAQLHTEIAGKPEGAAEGEGRPYYLNFGPIATMDFRLTDWMLLTPSLQPNLLQLFGSGSTYGFNRNSVGELVTYLKVTDKFMLRAGGAYAIGAENAWTWTAALSWMAGNED